MFFKVLLDGILGQSPLSTTLDYISVILGFSIARNVIANYDIRELCKICFSLAFFDWLLYAGNTQFKLNIKNRFNPFFGFRSYLWK